VRTIRKGTYGSETHDFVCSQSSSIEPGYRLLVASDVQCHETVKHIVVILHRQLGAPFSSAMRALHAIDVSFLDQNLIDTPKPCSLIVSRIVLCLRRCLYPLRCQVQQC